MDAAFNASLVFLGVKVGFCFDMRLSFHDYCYFCKL